MKRVFVNGTFDIIHPGHLELLRKAKSLGDHLLVAIDSDDRVRRLKGADRPINDVSTRKVILENLKPVDYVTSFDTDEDLINIVRRYSPDVMMVGSDYRDKRVIGSEYAGRLVFFNRIHRYSSTRVIEKIRNEDNIRATDV